MRRWLAIAMLAAACSRGDASVDRHEEPSSGAAMWGAGYFPNVTLTTHEGKRVRFFDDLIRGKVVAINFIYTRCADSCPMQTARMLEVQRLLADRLGKDIFFLSISIDPQDTPEVLAAYARAWHTGPGWTFLTGAADDITRLRKKLGVYQADLRDKDHDLGLVIGNQATGRWMKRSPYENPYVLANQLGSWLHNWKIASTDDRDYTKAPALRALATGEELFRTRCEACHTIGGGDVADVAQRRVGPDLLDVDKRRDRAWLEHWIAQPDEMLAADDPTARALRDQFGGIVMPNFRLSSHDVDEVLQYIAGASRAAQRAPAVEPIAALPTTAAALGGELPRILTAYEAVRVALVADDLDAAREHAAGLAQSALARGPRQIAAATDLAAARLGFGVLSQDVIEVLAEAPAARAGWRVFRCAMAPGYPQWIQRAATADNPYWGARMRSCGQEQARWTR